MIAQKVLATIAELSERADNLEHAARLPLPPDIHITELRRGLRDIRDTLRMLYVTQAKENPWEGLPDD